MITTVTLNTMVDKTVYVEKIEKGHIQRARHTDRVAGGKGVNVSRQLTVLGLETIATGFYGGETGEIIGRLMSDEKIPHDFIKIGSLTREGVTYRENDGTVTAVFEPPHKVTPEEADALVRKCTDLASRSSWITLNGSSPHPNADTIYHDILERIQNTSVRTVLDTYGEALRLAIGMKPFLFKPNKQEFEKTFNIKLDSEKMYRRSLDACIERGINCTIITDGTHPAYVGTPDGYWLIHPPQIDTINPTGSGDALIAGIIYGFEHKMQFEDAIIFGMAAGAANAQTWSVANSTLDGITKLKNLVKIKKLV
jgi:1-phosphofructokinase family hexose kinase